MSDLHNYKVIFSQSLDLIAVLEKTPEGYFFPIFSHGHVAVIMAKVSEKLGRQITNKEFDEIGVVHMNYPEWKYPDE